MIRDQYSGNDLRMNRVELSARSSPDLYPELDTCKRVASAYELIPLFWLALFREEEIAIRTRLGKPFPDAKNVYAYLVTRREDAIARLEAVRGYLLVRLPKNAAPLFDEWQKWLGSFDLPFLHLDPKHVAFAVGPKIFEEKLRQSLRAIATHSPDSLSEVLRYNILPLKNRSQKSIKAFRAPLTGEFFVPLEPVISKPFKKFATNELSRERLTEPKRLGIHFFLPQQDFPTPAQWVQWFDELGEKVCWRIWEGGQKSISEVPADYTGWYLQHPHRVPLSERGIFFDTLQRDSNGIYMNIVKDSLDALSLFRTTCEIVAKLPGVRCDAYGPTKIKKRELN